jgi:hypothetical protein
MNTPSSIPCCRPVLLVSALLVTCFGCGKTDDPLIEVEGPRVVSTNPADQATGVARDAVIAVTFDRPVAASSLTAATFYLDPDVASAVSWDESTLTATLIPHQLLDTDTNYTVHLTTGVTSANGTSMVSQHSFRFSTGQALTPGQTRVTTHTFGDDTVTVTIRNPDSLTRTYTVATTAALRDNEPSSKQVTLTEQEGQMILRSGNDLFDALFAMAIDETRQLSVSSISDGAFNNGQGVPCDCFETGAKWNYVWTRDTAYAVDLGLAFVDPRRSKNSLDFKLSELKQGGGLQIVQDTGSGGSYPVSTDRVVWAIGAWEVLKFLDGPEREAFRNRTLEAMKNTIEQDRELVFDSEDGLYRGEQSFLDWREQSYPSYTADDTVHIAMSKTLSTNVGHYALLRFASELAIETGDQTTSVRYARWASELAAAIERELWLDSLGAYSAMKTTTLNPAPTHKLDLLGLSLAVLQELPSTTRAESIVSTYPRSTMGAPVLWPQQPLIPIYHNRGIWPFVTAYALLASRQARNSAVFDHDLATLVRGAAVNLSHMENFEFLTLGNWVDDGPHSGPVVNSRRQLWSVAGFVGAIVKGVFGLEATQQAITFEPFISAELRRQFAEADAILLSNLAYRGKRIDVEVRLPADVAGATGPLQISSVTVDGAASTGPLRAETLGERSVVVVTLGAATGAAGTKNTVEDVGDHRRFWAPREPEITSLVLAADRLALEFHGHGEEGIVFNIYRDGVEVASNLTETRWTDANSAAHASTTYCYTVESVFTVSGNRSHHSPIQCYWGEGLSRIKEVDLFRFRNEGGAWSLEHGRPHYMDWGRPQDVLEVAHLRPDWTGRHYVQFTYGNGAGSIPTGITAAVKEVVFTRVSDGARVAGSYVVMPQLGDWSRWGESTLMPVDLDSGEVYRVTITDGINMSYFAHFAPYTGGNGGGGDSYNMVNIASMKLLSMGGTRRPSAPDRVGFNGQDDLGKIDESRRLVPGAQSQPWSAFGLEWNDDDLFIAMVSESVAVPHKPVMIYLEAITGTPSEPAASQGLEYSGQVPTLPFSANYAIALRRVSALDGDGPWNGIWRRTDTGWQRQERLATDVDYWPGQDGHTLAARIPRAALGSPDQIRLVAHVVHEVQAEEWKDVIPADHTPWENGGGFLTYTF